ncbi:MAG: hypothetical protein KGH61_02095 [Candidatus Micrarchaeota archaeon]|nr:hypothetical protein [Candidatus Micrarchaeota archaeon]MDE1847722.1 hypothetical protein [Candidatus Micrarchaeota archaeon]MDE1864151.1 hypothetical protein [Candidatus Micrarchaeota archaeon]
MQVKPETSKAKLFGNGVGLSDNGNLTVNTLYVSMNGNIGSKQLIPLVRKLFIKTLKETYPEAKHSVPSDKDDYKWEGGILQNGISVSTPDLSLGYVINFYRTLKGGKPSDLAIEITKSYGVELDPKFYEAVNNTISKLGSLSSMEDFKMLARKLRNFDVFADSIRL